jgi:hypothetical protein
LLRFELIPLRDNLEQALTWTRPDFLVLRYELRAPEGAVAQVKVSGMGDSKHAVGETSEGRWRFQVFPFASDVVSIQRDEDQCEIGSYLRQPPFDIRLAGTGSYRISDGERARPQSNLQSTLEDNSGQPIFAFEQLESFPRWQAAVRVNPLHHANADLPILLISACCIRVFR